MKKGAIAVAGCLVLALVLIQCVGVVVGAGIIVLHLLKGVGG